ncbi:o-antigen polymerase [hydrocarbon metagenome]|uniref:O-antigen polymerase n=1 Tax=hydrocarbon metagenome TaxID=938273 RepID=A0A0W8E8M0_9ZZZZ
MDRVKGSGWGIELYLVVLYVILDWFFRQVAFTSLQGIWDELLFIFIVGVWIYRIAVDRLRPEGSSMLLPIILYAAVMIFLFLINSPSNVVALEGARVMMQYIFWFFLGYNLLFTRIQAKGLVDVFLLVCTLVALYGIYQYLTGVEIPLGWVDSKETSITTRVFSIIGSPNILGSLIVLALPLAFTMYFTSSSAVKKLFYAGLLLPLALCLVLTYSRGAWLAFILEAILLGLWVDRRIIIAMVLIAILTPTLMPTVYDRMAYMASPEYLVSSERGGRLGRWDKALDYWQTSPAVGVGLGEFGGAVAARYYPQDSFYADNWYLKVGTETGWVGLLATLLLFVIALRKARRSLDITRDDFLRFMGLGIFIGMIGVLAHNCVENVFEVPMMASYFWFFLGVILALPYLSGSSPVQNKIGTGPYK